MSDFHYETLLLQSADEYGSVTKFKRFSQPSHRGFCFAKILQKSKKYFREKHDWIVTRVTNTNTTFYS